jgi:hypothetical protein
LLPASSTSPCTCKQSNGSAVVLAVFLIY